MPNRRVLSHLRRGPHDPAFSPGYPRVCEGWARRGISCTIKMPNICDLWTLRDQSSTRARLTPTVLFASSLVPGPREACCASPDIPDRPDLFPAERFFYRNRPLEAFQLSGSAEAWHRALFSLPRSQVIDLLCVDPKNIHQTVTCDNFDANKS